VGVEEKPFGFGGLLEIAIKVEVAVVAVADNGVVMKGGLDTELVGAASFGGKCE